MSKKLPIPPPPSRYSYVAAVQELNRRIEVEANKPDGKSQKEIGAFANLDESAFSHRLTGLKSKLSLEHFGAIADRLDAPPGWPFVPWVEVATKPEPASPSARRGHRRSPARRRK